jgi:hypothetical protein
MYQQHGDISLLGYLVGYTPKKETRYADTGTGRHGHETDFTLLDYTWNCMSPVFSKEVVYGSIKIIPGLITDVIFANIINIRETVAAKSR